MTTRTEMQLGTAKITPKTSINGKTYFLVTWANHGNFSRPAPRAYMTEAHAHDFCRERGLKVVRS